MGPSRGAETGALQELRGHCGTHQTAEPEEGDKGDEEEPEKHDEDEPEEEKEDDGDASLDDIANLFK